MRSFRTRRPLGRQGSILVLAAITFVVLCAFAALVVDLGYVGVIEARLQTATDAGALAGARVLDGTQAGLDAARSRAVAFAAQDSADGDPLQLDPNPANDVDGDVVTGVWDGTSFRASINPVEVNAVQTRAGRDDLESFFSHVAFGRNTLSVAVESIAVAGQPASASKVPWYLPFGLPDCLWDSFEPGQLETMTFVLSPAGVDNTGWATVNGVANAAFLFDHFAAVSPCMQEWAATGEVTETCAEIALGDPLDLHNGTVASGQSYIAHHIGTEGVPWDSDLWGSLPAQDPDSAVSAHAYGYTYVGPIPVFDGPTTYCTTGGAWNETWPVVGFTWAVIYDVTKGSGSTGQTIKMRIDTDSFYGVGSWPGLTTTDYGVQADTPSVLVQ